MDGGTFAVIKTLILPAAISLTIFLLLTYILLPIWRRHRTRYSQYLPLDAISSSTSSLRHRATTYLVNLLFSFRSARSSARSARSSSNGDSNGDSNGGLFNGGIFNGGSSNTGHSLSPPTMFPWTFFPNRQTGSNGSNDILDGQELLDVHVDTLRDWEAQARPRPEVHTRRLSRELEEGFRDDSDGESVP